MHAMQDIRTLNGPIVIEFIGRFREKFLHPLGHLQDFDFLIRHVDEEHIHVGIGKRVENGELLFAARLVLLHDFPLASGLCQRFFQPSLRLVLLVHLHDHTVGANGRAVGAAIHIGAVAVPVVLALGVQHAVLHIIAGLGIGIENFIFVLRFHQFAVFGVNPLKPNGPGIFQVKGRIIADEFLESRRPDAAGPISFFVKFLVPQAGDDVGVKQIRR